MGVRDAQTISDTEVRIRGEAEKLGANRAAWVLERAHVPRSAAGEPENRVGRLELAQWLASDQKRAHFSRAGQSSPGITFSARGWCERLTIFGVMGDVPSHPELLDHLADRFVREGWSVKSIVRKIVLSRGVSPQLRETPPRTRRSTQPTAWCGDTTHAGSRPRKSETRPLAVSGELDPSRPEASPARALRVVELPNNGPLAHRLDAEGRASRHRSLYLPLLRTLVPTALEVFDFAEQGFRHREPRPHDRSHSGSVLAERSVRAETGPQSGDSSPRAGAARTTTTGSTSLTA